MEEKFSFPLGTILCVGIIGTVGGNQEGFIRVRHFVVPPSGVGELCASCRKSAKVELIWWKLAQASIADFSRPQIWIYRFHLLAVAKNGLIIPNNLSHNLPYFAAKSKPIGLLKSRSLFTWHCPNRANACNKKFLGTSDIL